MFAPWRLYFLLGCLDTQSKDIYSILPRSFANLLYTYALHIRDDIRHLGYTHGLVPALYQLIGTSNEALLLDCFRQRRCIFEVFRRCVSRANLAPWTLSHQVSYAANSPR